MSLRPLDLRFLVNRIPSTYLPMRCTQKCAYSPGSDPASYRTRVGVAVVCYGFTWICWTKCPVALTHQCVAEARTHCSGSAGPFHTALAPVCRSADLGQGRPCPDPVTLLLYQVSQFSHGVAAPPPSPQDGKRQPLTPEARSQPAWGAPLIFTHHVYVCVCTCAWVYTEGSTYTHVRGNYGDWTPFKICETCHVNIGKDEKS